MRIRLSGMVVSRANLHVRALLSRGISDASGVAAIEFAIVVPMLLMMVICTVDLGMGLYRNMQVQNSAQAGARYAMTNSFDSNSISNAVSSATGLQGIEASPPPSQYCGCATSSGIAAVTCGSTCPAGAVYGAYVNVAAQGSYTPIIPYPLIASKFTLKAQANVRVQ